MQVVFLTSLSILTLALAILVGAMPGMETPFIGMLGLNAFFWLKTVTLFFGR
jgi:hypothetical protein